MQDQLECSWQHALQTEFTKPYFIKLQAAVKTAYQTETVYPPRAQLFAAFTACPLPQTNVVILGQDPYHGPNQANGLAFSVPEDQPLPPSLQNIYKELVSDLTIPKPKTCHLQHWAEQRVLLLNTTLSVRAGVAESHRSLGWDYFTDQVIRVVSERRDHAVFLLWGNHARSKISLIDQDKHLVLEAAHPSPLSAYRGFFGCRHFSQTNAYLQKHNKPIIYW